MHVVVIGAGVIGVTTAYYLSRAGCEVTIIDSANEVAAGASHANGGQLSYSFTDALAKPEFIAKIPALIAGRDRGSRVRLSFEMLSWGWRFLSQCTREKARRNTIAMLQTAMRSAQLLQKLHRDVEFDFSHRVAGKLVVLSDNEDLAAAKISSRIKNEYGCDTDVLTRDESVQLEPALASLSQSFAGAVYSRNDEVADARLFTVRLKDWLEQNGAVRFMLGSPVEKIPRYGDRVRSVLVAGEEIEADATIVCAGAWSTALLQPLGIDTHIYPVRGYSVTLPPGEQAPMVSVTALKQRIVFSRINGQMRIAGFADFGGFSTNNDSKRQDMLVDVARRFAPQAADYGAQDRAGWGGFRPMTPNGQPCTGRTSLAGLYLNTGHGMLGWTLACASGRDIAQTVTNITH